MARTLFGDCSLDPESRVIMRAGRPVHLTPKAFDLLELLLKRRPKAISKSDLMGALWPGVAVTEGSLANLVSEIRITLEDTARTPRYIRTVHRFGYAFSADAMLEDMSGRASLGTGPRFRLVAAQGEADLAEGDNLVGRADDCRLRIESSTVSRHHARLRVQGDEVWVEDLGSKNGTLVEGHKIQAPTPLRGGELIRVGAIELRFAASSPLTTTDTLSLRAKPAP
ncbi:MAG TPA: FHA domain-containing protein [Vicinamibacteria bacterium]